MRAQRATATRCQHQRTLDSGVAASAPVLPATDLGTDPGRESEGPMPCHQADSPCIGEEGVWRRTVLFSHASEGGRQLSMPRLVNVPLCLPVRGRPTPPAIARHVGEIVAPADQGPCTAPTTVRAAGVPVARVDPGLMNMNYAW